MLLDLEATVFNTDGDQDPYLVITLVRFALESRHNWFPPPHLVEVASRYLEKHFSTMRCWPEFLRNAATASAWQSPRQRPAARITVENLEPIVNDLSKAAVVVVENGRNDGSFLRAVFAAYAPELAEALSRDWLQLDHAGGTGEQGYVADESAIRFRSICRVVVVKDNDKRHADPAANSGPDNWPPEKPYLHIWRRLEVENYLPDVVLHLSEHPRAAALVHHLRAMTAEQQRWIDMKGGLAKGPLELFRDIDQAARGVWQSGFGKRFPKPLVPPTVTLTVDDFRSLGDDVHDELVQLVQRIRAVT